MRDNEKLVVIAEFENSFDAELAKITLENAGIPCAVFGAEMASTMTYNPVLFHLELRVFEQDADRAREILSEKDETPQGGQ